MKTVLAENPDTSNAELVAHMSYAAKMYALSVEAYRIQVQQVLTGHWMRHWVVTNLFLCSRHVNKNGATCTSSSATVHNFSCKFKSPSCVHIVLAGMVCDP